MKKILLFILPLLFGCCAKSDKMSPAHYVNPFIGTDGHGHTFPGAAVPFGLVQLSPDTGTSGWDWASGYHSSDNSIIGFSHSHLSGTGSADLGDILFMPTLSPQYTPGSKENPDEGYRSNFSHESEKAEAGYYSVYLDDAKTQVELTATSHTGVQKYSFDTDAPHYVMLDLSHGISDKPVECYVKKISNTAIEGYRKSSGWADSHTVCFYTEFSAPFDSMEVHADSLINKDVANAQNVIASFKFPENVSILEIKTALSYVDIDGAKCNFNSEVADKDFQSVREQAFMNWNQELSRVDVDGDKTRKEIFYTALYHTMIAPYLLSDVDGRYRSSNTNVYNSEDQNYGLYSTWDTFRALHPLLTVVVPEKNTQFVRSLIRYYEESGRLPIWDLNMRENFCMIGYHSVPIIADAFFKGEDFDAEKALEAMVHSSKDSVHAGLNCYLRYKYIPFDLEPNSVSKALEFSYDDWCIAKMAKALGKNDIYAEYIKRAQYYKNQFDSSDAFMKGRDSYGFFRKNFSAMSTDDFTEGNSWNYSFFCPQDLNTLINFMGGDEKFEAKLDELFTSESVADNGVLDMTGLIGNYVHGNEPSHHFAYLYAYVGKQWKTAEMASKICTSLYGTGRDGLCGNDDCGQMSAWYVLSAMGFYEVTPGSSLYVLGSPQFDKIVVNGKFILEAENLSKENIYIGSATWNGSPYEKSYITHDMIVSGGKLVLKMQSVPSAQFGQNEESRPHSVISENAISTDELLSSVKFKPFVDVKESFFTDSIKLKPLSIVDADIYYSLDGSDPVHIGKKLAGFIVINNDAELKLASKRKGFNEFSEVSSFLFYKGRIPSARIEYSAPSEKYSGETSTLIDGLHGDPNFANGGWLGWNGGDLTISVELPEEKQISYVGIDFMSYIGAWISIPESYTIEFDTPSGKVQHKVIITDDHCVSEKIRLCGTECNVLSKKFKITIPKNLIPNWHNLHGNLGWVFIDEILVK